MAETDRLGRTPVILVVFLTIVTCGAYVPIWYIRRRSILAGLKTSTKPARYLPYGLLFLYIVAVLNLFLLHESVITDPSMKSSSAAHFYSVLSATYFAVHAFLAFTVVEILHEYSYQGLSLMRSIAFLRATILSVIYLQYEMNRLPAPVDGICPPPKDT